MSDKKSWSWGNYPLAAHELKTFSWKDQTLDSGSEQKVLPYGYGRSYGDVPLNDGGRVISTRGFNRIIEFDRHSGVFCCEAGMSFSDILQVIVPAGWFLPVTPGTQYVSIGGALANDVHGKNHHLAGTFGCHILGFELLRSNGTRLWCNSQDNADLFRATIGGLGLTGLVTQVRIQLIAIKSAAIDVNTQRFNSLEEGLDLFDEHKNSNYSVAWIDCLAKGQHLGRGIFSSGEHSAPCSLKKNPRQVLSVPFNFPSFALNNLSVAAFNKLYFLKGGMDEGHSRAHYAGFFYPLDSIANWNRIYGKRGFFQYQCVLPFGTQGEGKTAIRELLNRIADNGSGSFLAVLKTFGDRKSPGMLSFPREGITLALDFQNRGKSTLDLLSSLDNVLRENGGRIYPAKDARMTSADFQIQYPQWQAFSQYIDPAFSSDFWKRVTGSKGSE